MSKHQGRIERAIAQVLDTEPDNACQRGTRKLTSSCWASESHEAAIEVKSLRGVTLKWWRDLRRVRSLTDGVCIKLLTRLRRNVAHYQLPNFL